MWFVNYGGSQLGGKLKVALLTIYNLILRSKYTRCTCVCWDPSSLVGVKMTHDEKQGVKRAHKVRGEAEKRLCVMYANAREGYS